jgi:hypothetical protein
MIDFIDRINAIHIIPASRYRHTSYFVYNFQQKALFSRCISATLFTEMKIIQTRIGLANQYGIHRQTFTKWLVTIGITHNKALTPIELQIVMNKIGTPEQLRQVTAQLLK